MHDEIFNQLAEMENMSIIVAYNGVRTRMNLRNVEIVKVGYQYIFSGDDDQELTIFTTSIASAHVEEGDYIIEGTSYRISIRDEENIDTDI